MSDLIGVAVGGMIALCGGAGTQWLMHHLKTQTELRQRRAVKFEEAVALVYEYDHWLDEKRNRVVFGEQNSETLSPYAKIYALAAVYFPQFLVTVTALRVAARKYEMWMLMKMQKRLENKLLELNDGFTEAYADFNELQERLLNEFTAYADKVFKPTTGISLFWGK
jgi:hypothetical protein